MLNYIADYKTDGLLEYASNRVFIGTSLYYIFMLIPIYVYIVVFFTKVHIYICITVYMVNRKIRLNYACMWYYYTEPVIMLKRTNQYVITAFKMLSTRVAYS